MKRIGYVIGWRTVGTLGYLFGLAVLTHRFVALRNVERWKLKNQVKAAPLRSFCYLCMLTESPPPVNSFQRRATIERAEDMDRSMPEFSISFWLALELQKKMRKIRNQLPYKFKNSRLKRSATTSCNCSCRFAVRWKNLGILCYYSLILQTCKMPSNSELWYVRVQQYVSMVEYFFLFSVLFFFPQLLSHPCLVPQ